MKHDVDLATFLMDADDKLDGAIQAADGMPDVIEEIERARQALVRAVQKMMRRPMSARVLPS